MHKLLENYLSEIEEKLIGLPKKRRVEELREMHGHLRTAMASAVDQGQSENEAAASVVAQFGTPEEVGQQTAEAWKRGNRLDQRSFANALLSCVLLSFASYVIRVQPWRAPVTLTDALVHSPRMMWLQAHDFLGGLVGGILVGGLIGYFFPRRAAWGTLTGTALWLVIYGPIRTSVSALHGTAYPYIPQATDMPGWSGYCYPIQMGLTVVSIVALVLLGNLARSSWRTACFGTATICLCLLAYITAQNLFGFYIVSWAVHVTSKITQSGAVASFYVAMLLDSLLWTSPTIAAAWASSKIQDVRSRTLAF